VAEKNLSNECTKENNQEVNVMSKRLEHIKLTSSYLSAVDLVKQLEENESVEDVCEVSLFVLRFFESLKVNIVLSLLIIVSGFVWLRPTSWSLKVVVKTGNHFSETHDKYHHQNIPSRNSEDLSHNGWRQNGGTWRVFGILEWLTFDYVLERRLSGECKSCKCVHDHINPE